MRRARFPFLELAVIVWVAIWIVMGYLVAREVHSLSSLGDTVVLAGKSVRQTAETLDTLKDVPFVGSQLHRIATDARRTASSAVANGADAHDSVDRLAVLLWIVVAVAPSVPALFGYLWCRRQTVRLR